MTTRVANPSFTFRRFLVFAVALVIALAGAGAWLSAQAVPAAQAAAPATAQAAAPAAATKALTTDDYTKWRAVAGQEMSGDGTWLVYTLALTNTIAAEAKPVLHIVNLESGADVTVNDASDADFSPDSQWVAYQVDPGAAQRARAARTAAAGSGGAGTTPSGSTPATTPAQTGAPAAQGGTQGQSGRGGGAAAIPPRRVELRNLATGAVRSWQDIGTFVFSPASTHLVLRRRGTEAAGAAGGRGGGAPGGPGGGQGGGRGGGATTPAGLGNDALLLDLRTGGHQLLGSVAEIAFNRTGELLAFTVNAAVKDGDGVFVFDTRNGRTTVLDNDAKLYSRLQWNEAGTGIAVLKGSDVERMRERDNVLVAFPDITAALKDGAAAAVPEVLEPAKAEGLPKGWVISDRAALAWSEDNARVFFGVKEQVPAEDTTRRSIDEAANVDVWNTADERVQSLQMIRANQDRNFAFRSAFAVAAKKYIRLADETMKEVDVAPDGTWAVGRDVRGYLLDRKEPAADFYRVNTSTGERTLFAKGQLTGRHVFGISPHGTHFLFWKGNRFQAYAFGTGVTTPLGGASTLSFADMEDDHPGTKPPYGVSGYASDGKAVIANHRYDLWLLPLDGSTASNLTVGLGTKNETRFRLVRTAPPDLTLPRAVGPRGTFDLTKPLTLSAYGQWTKKAGFYELAGGQMKALVYEDASFSTPVKAMKADRFLFTRQTFVEFPDLRVSGPGFADAKKITDANPQQKDFLWGHRVLFDYKNKDGVRLQGILAIPDDYKPGEKRPMIVTFYEKNSQNMHVYTPPVYMVSMGRMPTQATSAGYLTMMPDVHFRTGSSHSDMLECVEAATRKVIEMGYADPARIGVTGHSYGGEGAAYIGTMSKMFAAVGMGAGVVDLTNDFAMPWGWSYAAPGGSGDTAFNYYLYDQGRWGFSPWDQPDRYRNESALTWAPRAVAPFLIMHGTSDPTVGFINGLAFYNALRYNGKKAVLLAYPNEGHHLAGLANQRDLTVRFMEFMDHYLKGAKAPAWLTDGVPYLKKDAKPEPPREPAPAASAKPEATSLLGTPLYAIELAPDAKQAVEARVVAAREALSKAPDSADAILWLGRQTAAAGRVRLAIDIFTKGIEKFPADPRFYRHRGHRYVTVREFDKAIADLAKAAQLIKGKPDQPEPSTADAKVMSSETLHYAIYYHLGLAHYLKGDFAAALPVYQQCLAAAKANASDDLLAGASDWLYMTLRRLGRTAEAAKVLEPIVPGMKVKDDQQYYDRLMMYKGAKKPEELLAPGRDPVSAATLAYGVANWHLYNGRKDEAKALFQKIVTGPNWMPFGFIAAEAELARMK